MIVRNVAVSFVIAVVLAGCSTGTGSGGSTASDDPSTTAEAVGSPSPQSYPDVLSAELMAQGGDTYTISVTISSPYDSPDRYADGWRVLTTDGQELGSHTLGHDHASEQPFTRTQSGLQVPSDVTEVVVEGRDTQNGYGGKTITVAVPSAAG